LHTCCAPIWVIDLYYVMLQAAFNCEQYQALVQRRFLRATFQYQ
jgi:hypothetical protein